MEISVYTKQAIHSPSVHHQFTDNFYFTISTLNYAGLVPVHDTAMKYFFHWLEIEKGHGFLFKWQWHIDSTQHSSLTNTSLIRDTKIQVPYIWSYRLTVSSSNL